VTVPHLTGKSEGAEIVVMTPPELDGEISLFQWIRIALHGSVFHREEFIDMPPKL